MSERFIACGWEAWLPSWSGEGIQTGSMRSFSVPLPATSLDLRLSA
jgi:hypothetical protein